MSELVQFIHDNHCYFHIQDSTKKKILMDWSSLLDPESPHKLMYSLQIVESLSRLPKHRRRSVVSPYRAVNYCNDMLLCDVIKCIAPMHSPFLSHNPNVLFVFTSYVPSENPELEAAILTFLWMIKSCLRKSGVKR